MGSETTVWDSKGVELGWRYLGGGGGRYGGECQGNVGGGWGYWGCYDVWKDKGRRGMGLGVWEWRVGRGARGEEWIVGCIE